MRVVNRTPRVQSMMRDENGNSLVNHETPSLLPAKIQFARVWRSGCFHVAEIAFIASVVLIGCGKRPVRDDKPSSVDSVASPGATVRLTKVEVPPEGKQFNPPVRLEQLPAGVWYCDMGTVHWAQMNEGNHLCPICKMDLKQKN